MREKGIIALTLPLFLIIIAAVVFILISQGIIKLPSKLTTILPGKSQDPTVSLQTQYENPFDGKFVNPFAGYKNPFDGLK